MAKRKKSARPFFSMRFEMNDTLEALSHEILMCIQAMETAIELGGLNEAGKGILTERVNALKEICMSDHESAG